MTLVDCLSRLVPVSEGIQRASLRSLLMLADAQPDSASGAVISWMTQHLAATPHATPLDPVTSRLLETFLDTYAPKMDAVARFREGWAESQAARMQGL